MAGGDKRNLSIELWSDDSFFQIPKWATGDRTQYVGSMSVLITIVMMILYFLETYAPKTDLPVDDGSKMNAPLKAPPDNNTDGDNRCHISKRQFHSAGGGTMPGTAGLKRISTQVNPTGPCRCRRRNSSCNIMQIH